MPASSYYNTHRILGSLIVPDLSLLEGVLLVANKQDLSCAQSAAVFTLHARTTSRRPCAAINASPTMLDPLVPFSRAVFVF